MKANTIPANPDFRVTGTVAYMLSADDTSYQLLLNDGDAAMKITSTTNPPPIPQLGDRVQLEGELTPVGQGNVRPVFRNLEILGHEEAPAPHEGAAKEIMSGRHDFRRSYLVCEVRDVEPSGSDPNWNYLSVIADRRQYYAPIPTCGASLAQLESLIGAKVRLDGYPDSHNCSFRFLDERRFVVAGIRNIKILSPPPDDPFTGTPDVEELRRLSPESLRRLGRHKAEGWLVTVWQSRHALLQMRDGRMAMVDFASPSKMRRGESVEVVGYPSTDGFFLRLSRAIARRVSGETLAEKKAEALSEDHVANLLSADFPGKCALQGKRVRIPGFVAEFDKTQQDRKTISLSIAGHLLEVDFSSAPRAAEKIAAGCRIQVTGTCVLATENWASLSTGTTLNGIRLVVDRPDDVEILARPPWWNLTRLSVVITLLVIVIAAILFWNRELRKLSEKRGRELFHERSASALAELKTAERTRLAADIHDSISQILTGAAMQLDAGETNAAKRILASCRRELRACLWDLRNHALDADNFADAVRETLAPHLGGHAAAIDMDIPSAKMSEALRHTALSIIREATVNAIRHGRADTIEIVGKLEGRRLSFTVTDDGRGFDPKSCRGSKDGHFGILGMKERAKAFNGSIEIASAPGKGTTVSVVLKEEEAT
ncbi:MAG: sensor histidine kinase [Kiritimatiellae bacterium]|nr:sensor histidine kinase [Kiritimatiellia bacterium]